MSVRESGEQPVSEDPRRRVASASEPPSRSSSGASSASGSSTCRRRSRATARSRSCPWVSPRWARSPWPCCSRRCRGECRPTVARTRMPAWASAIALGFANAWSYWITAWAGNAAIAVGWVLYVEEFVNKGHNKLGSVLLVLVGLWIPAVINLSGVKNMGSVQVVTTVLKFVALAFMSTVGLFYITTANYTPWNVSGESAISCDRRRAWRSRCSATSASRSRRSRPARCAIPTATSRGRRFSAPSRPRWSTCSP